MHYTNIIPTSHSSLTSHTFCKIWAAFYRNIMRYQSPRCKQEGSITSEQERKYQDSNASVLLHHINYIQTRSYKQAQTQRNLSGTFKHPRKRQVCSKHLLDKKLVETASNKGLGCLLGKCRCKNLQTPKESSISAENVYLASSAFKCSCK